MIIHIYGKNYKLDPALASTAKNAINQILNQVKKQSGEKGIGRFYIAFVIMMYVISLSILEQLSPSALKELEKEKPH